MNLGILSCPITDEGLTHLEHFALSREMRLIGTNVTEKDVGRLQHAFPGCAILYDSDGVISDEEQMLNYERRESDLGKK